MTGLFPGKRHLPAKAEEVIASDSSMRIASFGRVPHYPVSDTRGNDAPMVLPGRGIVLDRNAFRDY